MAADGCHFFCLMTMAHDTPTSQRLARHAARHRSHRHPHPHPVGVPDRRVFLGLLALLVWAPLPLGSNRIWAIGILLAAALLLLLGTFWAWRGQAAAAVARLRPFALPLTLLSAMCLLTWFQTLPLPANWVEVISPVAAQAQTPAAEMTLSLDAFQTRNMGVLAFSFLAVFLVTVLSVRDATRLDRLALVLVASGVLQTVLGAILFSIKAEYRIFYTQVSHNRMIGSFVYHNSMAGYLCMCLSVGVGLMLARLSESAKAPIMTWKARVVEIIDFALSPKMRLRAMLVIMVIGLVLTRSRMGNAGFFTALLVVGLVAIVLARKTAPKTIALIASLVIIDVLVVGSWVGLEKVVERIQQTELSVADGGLSESIEARTEAARASLPLVQDFLAVGSGGGSFYNLFLSYRPASYGYSYIDHTHNDYVELAADYGLAGLGTLGLLVALTLWKTLQVLAKRRSVLPRGIAFGVAMAIVWLLVHSTVDFNMQIPANALTMVVILAMGWLAHAMPRGANTRPAQ
jgi:O-antigen ligase